MENNTFLQLFYRLLLLRIDIVEVFGFPDKTSFKGGYDIKCNLEIVSNVYCVRTNNYYSSTSVLYNFYNELKKCYETINGKVQYVDYTENKLIFDVIFKNGKVVITGRYEEDSSTNNILNFEFLSDQSYFPKVLDDLKVVIDKFGNNQGIK
mgnify:CR=1 FL=1